jgi:galactokinase
MREVEQRALEAYRGQFGDEPAVVASAPGRVNLIGEHTDYSGGFVFPCAIDRRVGVALGTGSGGFVSTDFDEVRPARGKDGSWADYPRGVIWALGEAGHPFPEVRAAFAGDVPRASGLSSSAAIEAATALALDTLVGLGLARTSLAMLCQRAENAFVGVNCGIMDQYAALLSRAGAALRIDCRSLESEVVPLPLDRAELALFVCDTRVKRGLGATAYNERRASCERAAAAIGVPLLRDATLVDLSTLQGTDLKRARHVVTEDERVLDAVAALRAGDFAELGRLMYASHDSLRDDFDVSIPELDTFVETARRVGAHGARLTGAGFGGCAIALISHDRVEDLARAAEARFAERGFAEPAFYVFTPSEGAEVVFRG